MNVLLEGDGTVHSKIIDVLRKHDVSESEMCRQLGLRRGMMNDWKQGDPKSIQHLKQIGEFLEGLENQSKPNVEVSFVENDAIVEGTVERICSKTQKQCKYECADGPCKLTT